MDVTPASGVLGWAGDGVAARAAVLGRLWGAYAREDLPGIAGRRIEAGVLTVTFTDGRAVAGPVDAAVPFAAVGPGLRLTGPGGEPIEDPAALLDTLPADPDPAAVDRRAMLRADLADSVTNLAAARAAQPPPIGGPGPLVPTGGPADLARLEQCIVDGHPLHPLCRTRAGMSAAEVAAYAPEHHPVVELAVVAVPPARWHSTGSGLPPRLVMHPWQVEHVLPAHPGLVPAGVRVPAWPLASLRTLAPRRFPGLHVKTAVDVRMTSAVRIVSPAAVHNGPVVTALLARMAAGLPVEICVEPAAGCVLVDGQPCASLAVVHRHAPTQGPWEVVLPVAALSARSPASGRPLLAEAADLAYRGDPAAFVTAFAALAVPAVARLLHLGVALEAHGQNLLVVLRRGRVTRAAYRDVGGVRISPRRLAAAGIEPPPLRGAIATDDDTVLRDKLLAAFYATTLAELVATAARLGADPRELWPAIATIVRDTYAGLPSSTQGDHAATVAATLPLKATTAMRLAPSPLEDVWARIPNPLAVA